MSKEYKLGRSVSPFRLLTSLQARFTSRSLLIPLSPLTSLIGCLISAIFRSAGITLISFRLLTLPCFTSGPFTVTVPSSPITTPFRLAGVIVPTK